MASRLRPYGVSGDRRLKKGGVGDCWGEVNLFLC
jgi:hypothetical protein